MLNFKTTVQTGTPSLVRNTHRTAFLMNTLTTAFPTARVVGQQVRTVYVRTVPARTVRVKAVR